MSFSKLQHRDSSISMDNSREEVTKIAGIYAERLMSDVILVVGKQELAAHRLILNGKLSLRLVLELHYFRQLSDQLFIAVES